MISESEALLEEIDADPDMKASLDLANRNAAQVQIGNAELLRAQGIALSTSGRQVVHQELQASGDRMRTEFRGFTGAGAE